MKRGYFLCFYLIALAIPVALVGTGIFAPQVYGLESIDDYWSLMDETMEESGIEQRGSALVPFVRVSLIRPLFWTINIFAAAPTIAGVIMAGLYFGKNGLRTLIDRIRPWRDGVAASEGVRWWGLMMILLAALKLLEFGLYWLAGLNPQWIWGVKWFSLTFFWFYVSAMFLDQGGLLEETGWRGYALPLLQDSMKTPLHAALFLGVLWAAWHLPRELVNSYDSIKEFLLAQIVFFLISIFLTIIISFFFNKTGGSTLIAIAVHGLSNDSVGLGGSNVDGPLWLEEICRTIPYLVAAIMIVYCSDRKLGLRKNHDHGI
jgi:hypothetical protein